MRQLQLGKAADKGYKEHRHSAHSESACIYSWAAERASELV